MSEILSSKVVSIRKPQTCWGCLKKYPVGSQLLSMAIAQDGTVTQSYTCEYCESVMKDWGPDDFESTLNGDVGYWKNDTYHAHT